MKPTLKKKSKKVNSWDEVSDDMKNISDLQCEFHARFGGEKFNPYSDPVRVFNFFLERKDELE